MYIQKLLYEHGMLITTKK